MAAIANKLLKPGATAIVITSGPIGRRWNDVLRSLPCDIVDITVPFGEDLDLSLIEETVSRRNVQALFGAASEPSHGVLYDIEALGGALKRRGVRLAVDCTGALAIDEFKLDAWGIDYAIADSCAGLMTPGAGTFIASSTALADDQLVFPSGSGTTLDELFELSECTFEIDWLSPNALEALFTSLKMILASGLDVFLSHKQEVARSVRKGCLDVLHLDLATSRPSSGCTTVLLPPGVSGHELLEIIKAKYRVEIPIQTALNGREILCIGHSGWVFRDDVYRVIEALALGLEHLRMAVTGQKNH